MRTVDTEHHFVTPLYLETLRGRTDAPRVVEGKGLAYWEDADLKLILGHFSEALPFLYVAHLGGGTAAS